MATSAVARAPHHHNRRHHRNGNGAPRQRSADGQVFGVLLMVFGLGWFLRVSGAIEMDWESLVSGVLIVLGVGMAITARARTGGLLMVLGILLTISLATTSSVGELDIARGIGERPIVVRNASELEPDYRLFAGELTLDLHDLSLPRDATRSINADVSFGELVVILPPNVPVNVNATINVGEVDLLGEVSDGGDLSLSHVDEDFRQGERGLVLELAVNLGHISVRRAEALPGSPFESAPSSNPPQQSGDADASG